MKNIDCLRLLVALALTMTSSWALAQDLSPFRITTEGGVGNAEKATSFTSNLPAGEASFVGSNGFGAASTRYAVDAAGNYQTFFNSVDRTSNNSNYLSSSSSMLIDFDFRINTPIPINATLAMYANFDYWAGYPQGTGSGATVRVNVTPLDGYGYGLFGSPPFWPALHFCDYAGASCVSQSGYTTLFGKTVGTAVPFHVSLQLSSSAFAAAGEIGPQATRLFTSFKLVAWDADTGIPLSMSFSDGWVNGLTSAAVVPELSTVALFVTGLALLGIRVRGTRHFGRRED